MEGRVPTRVNEGTRVPLVRAHSPTVGDDSELGRQRQTTPSGPHPVQRQPRGADCRLPCNGALPLLALGAARGLAVVGGGESPGAGDRSRVIPPVGHGNSWATGVAKSPGGATTLARRRPRAPAATASALKGKPLPVTGGHRDPQERAPVRTSGAARREDFSAVSARQAPPTVFIWPHSAP